LRDNQISIASRKRKNQSLFSLVQGKAPLDDISTAENKVIERNLNLKHLMPRHIQKEISRFQNGVHWFIPMRNICGLVLMMSEPKYSKWTD
jgi:hypothetical protein